MKTSGWIFISLAWTCVISLVIYCFSKVFSSGNHQFSTEGEEQ